MKRQLPKRRDLAPLLKFKKPMLSPKERLAGLGVDHRGPAANPASEGGRNWFQLYMWKDRERSMALVDRAAKAGFDTLVVTVDVPVADGDL